MFKHALNDVIGALAVLGDLVEVAGQHLDGFINLGALVVVEYRERRRCGFLQLAEQFHREPSEVVDEV